MPKKFDPDIKDRAVPMVLDRVEEARSVTKAVALVAPKVDVRRETLRRWVSQYRVDAGLKGGPTSDDLAELTRLRGEVMGGGSRRTHSSVVGTEQNRRVSTRKQTHMRETLQPPDMTGPRTCGGSSCSLGSNPANLTSPALCGCPPRSPSKRCRDAFLNSAYNVPGAI